MTRFAAPALIAAVLTAAAVPATAQTPREVSPRTLRAETLRSVMVCASDIEARRTYQQAYGAPPAFVTAQEAVEARQAGHQWSAPRCMTQRQYDRLISMTQTRASL